MSQRALDFNRARKTDYFFQRCKHAINMLKLVKGSRDNFFVETQKFKQ